MIPYAVSAEDVLAELHVDATKGLSSSDVETRRRESGANELTEEPPEPKWKRFAAQFKELLVIVLIVAAAVSMAMGEVADSLAILAIVILNAVFGFVQEDRSERSLTALRKLTSPNARVIRDGATKAVPARELVVGDRIELEAGDHVPADARLLDAVSLRVQEAALTGESGTVTKEAKDALDPKTPLAERRNSVYFGTIVTDGKANAVVVATGMKTELGKIAGMLQRQPIEATPMQKRLAQVGKLIAWSCLGIVAVVFALEMLRGGKLLAVLLFSVSLAVAAVPEGLPAVVTLALAVGLQRMVHRNALVRRLPSVETLGSVTVICSDKTGTLTRNEMTAREIVLGDVTYAVTGEGYARAGDFRRDTAEGAAVVVADSPDLAAALASVASCSNARITMADDGASWASVGDPTEVALVIAARKGGVSASTARLQEIPFDATRKAMSVVDRAGEGARLTTKGAPEVVLAKCTHELHDGAAVPLTDERRAAIGERVATMAARALRVLAVATRDLPSWPFSGELEEELVFGGLFGMIDPPRAEAKDAVRKCHEAGIRAVMITGDHPATARAIAFELGLAERDDQVLACTELDGLDDAAFDARIAPVTVFARATAENKLQIVRALKARGEIVAMTGDGVNDAPAIRAADIGIAMGISGSDVTKDASSMVLTDDNFASIVNAVEEGRGIFDNVQKVLVYLLSCNLGEILFVLATSLLGWPMPLSPIQLLWINLVTDGLPALALALERPEPGVMQRPPRPPQEGILSWRIGGRLVWQGALVGGAALAAFAIHYGRHPNMLAEARTMAFCVLVYGELFRALAARSQTTSFFSLGIATNRYLLAAVVGSALLQVSAVTVPFLKPLFDATAHPFWEWRDVLLLALVPFTGVELMKVIERWRQSRRDGALQTPVMPIKPAPAPA